MKTLKQYTHSELSRRDPARLREDILAPLSSRTGILWLVGACLSLGAGIWLMVSSRVLGLAADAPAAFNDQLVGALTVLVTLVSMTRYTRPARIGNAALGLWLLISTWYLSGGTFASRWSSTAMAAVIMATSMFIGQRKRR
jgi:hypothetical protein